MVDFGTATTFEVISAKGEYLGGAIAPGLGLSADALFSRAARLSRVDIKRPAKVIGTNTVTPSANRPLLRLHRPGGRHPGAHHCGAWRRPKPQIIATGGLARQISEDSRYIAEIDDMLTLDGLLILFERNRTAGRAAAPH